MLICHAMRVKPVSSITTTATPAPSRSSGTDWRARCPGWAMGDISMSAFSAPNVSPARHANGLTNGTTHSSTFTATSDASAVCRRRPVTRP